jgi:hypothetical protein
MEERSGVQISKKAFVQSVIILITLAFLALGVAIGYGPF